MSKFSICSNTRPQNIDEVDLFIDDDENVNGPESLSMFWSDNTKLGPSAGHIAKYQICAVAIKCKHNSMLISSLHSPSRTEGLWLPYVAAKECYKYSQLPCLVAEFILRELG